VLENIFDYDLHGILDELCGYALAFLGFIVQVKFMIGLPLSSSASLPFPLSILSWLLLPFDVVESLLGLLVGFVGLFDDSGGSK
jgi:hypothetical protein